MSHEKKHVHESVVDDVELVSDGHDDLCCARETSGGRSQRRVETAAGDASFRTLLKAAGAAGLAEVLKGTGPFTVFAPTDQAFAALPAGTLEELLKPENKARLADLLKYHVAPGRILASEIVRLRSVRSLSSRDLPIRAQGGVVLIDDIRIAQTDLLCSNGIIHVLDGVLLPK